MEKNAVHEFETFKKCIETKFGTEMERNILRSFYSNYGNTKNIFEYMYNNLYTEKTTKLVKLNLQIRDESHKNGRKTELRFKNVELKKRLAKLQSKIESEDRETLSISQSVSDQQNRLNQTQTTYRNKEIGCIAQQAFVTKVQQVCDKFETAARSLNFISAQKSKDLECLKQNEVENLVSKLRKTTEINEFSRDEGKRVKAVNLIDLASFCNKQINEDGDNIEKITGSKYLNNEVELLVYQLDSDKLGRGKPNLNIFSRINDVHFENIRRDCERKKWINAKNSMAPDTKEAKLRLNKYLTGHFSGNALQLYVQYLGSHLSFKRVETELNEVRAAIGFLTHEVNALKEITMTTGEKSRGLKDMMGIIQKKQMHLEECLDQNSSCLDTDLKFNVCQVRSVSENLMELIGSFGNDGLNRTRADMTFQDNQNLSGGLGEVYSQFKAKFLVEDASRICGGYFTLENRNLFMKLFGHSEHMDQKNLFENMVEAYKEIKIKLGELNRMSRNLVKYNDIQSLNDELGESLRICREIDSGELRNYVEILMQDLKKIRNLKPEVKEIDGLVNIWQKQPGAYECIPNDLTVDGKTLGYFCEILERTIAQTERKNFHGGELVNEQVKNLLDYCNY